MTYCFKTHWVFAAFACIALPALANGDARPGQPDMVAADMAAADVVILGEVHDNPHHHAQQASLVAQLRPMALVLEMLTDDQAAQITPEVRRDEGALGAALGWEQSGWPDFSMYYPIFAAGSDARIFGAGLPRGDAQGALKAGVIEYFGVDAAAYGLDQQLDEEERYEREALQRAAHCDALPEVMLPMMVDLQRLRDAFLARAVVLALDETGGPVVVITGNGHARKDWGMAVYLQRALPEVTILALGQSEAGQIEGAFDQVLDTPATERPDPCLAFEKQG
jgi:uncharacterized iron-regulated protein